MYISEFLSANKLIIYEKLVRFTCIRGWRRRVSIYIVCIHNTRVHTHAHTHTQNYKRPRRMSFGYLETHNPLDELKTRVYMHNNSRVYNIPAKVLFCRRLQYRYLFNILRTTKCLYSSYSSLTYT